MHRVAVSSGRNVEILMTQNKLPIIFFTFLVYRLLAMYQVTLLHTQAIIVNF